MAVSKSELNYARANLSAALDILSTDPDSIRNRLLKASKAGLLVLCDNYFDGEALKVWQSIHNRLTRKCNPTLGAYGATIKTMRIASAVEIARDLRKLESLLAETDA
jgi:hypothetical protein